MSTLGSIAKQLVAPGKGILAADESVHNIEKKFAALGILNTEETRRVYRELLFTTPGIEQYVSGVILFDETMRQKTQSGTLFVDLLKQKEIFPGIKVDEGLDPLGTNGEKVTHGLDGLSERLAEYARMGAVFTKWRAIILIGKETPTEEALLENVSRLAQFAKLSQEAGMVPVVEPEVLIDGDHSIDVCNAVSLRTLTALFHALTQKQVDFSGILLKPSMVLPGKELSEQVSDEEIAKQTVEVLQKVVPPTVPGIVFLSGGQTSEDAARRLAVMNKEYGDKVPWQLSFSYGRALQAPAMSVWKGNASHVKAAQTVFLQTAENNSKARYGIFASK